MTLKLDLADWLSSNVDKYIWDNIKKYTKVYDESFAKYDLKWVLDSTFRFLDSVNNYVTTKEPWILMKDEAKQEEVETIMYTICESIRQVALNLYPFFPEKMSEVFSSLNLVWYTEKLESWKYLELKNEKTIFFIKEKSPILFEKYELE